MPAPSSILIVKPSSLGDIVHTLPAVACIKKQWPQARLSWIINSEWAPLLEGNPYVDEVIEFPRSRFRGISGWIRALSWLGKIKRRIHADLTLDFQGLFRSGLIARRCTTGSVWGLSDSREGARFFYNHTVQVPSRDEPMHAVNRTLALVKALGCEIASPLEWPLPTGNAPAGFALKEGFVVLHPFSRGEGKSLSIDQVQSFCRTLAPLQVVIAGRSDLQIESVPHVHNLLNQTSLPELCWLLRHASFVVSVDSGPMHLAAALAPRLLAIHTWSDPRKVGPYRPDALVWKDDKLGRMDSFPNGEPCECDKLAARIVELMA